jgi:hypothetical protein
MSRSYKKFPQVRAYYGKSGKIARNYANRKIRRLPLDCDIPNGRSFRKLYERCEIWDYAFTQFKEWEIQDWEETESRIKYGVHSRFWKAAGHTSLEETLADWKKTFLCK